jgi:type IV secretion system protein VirD4
MVLLGSKERTTLKEISELLEKETIDLDNPSENKGRERSHGISHQKIGKDLMTQDELAVMDNSKCILQLRGERPFLSDKYDVTGHPNYKYLSDENPNFSLNLVKEINPAHRVVIKQVTDIYNVGALESKLGQK